MNTREVSVAPFRVILDDKHLDSIIVDRLSALQLDSTGLPIQPTLPESLPSNKSASCCLDSLLVALLFRPNMFVDSCILNASLHKRNRGQTVTRSSPADDLSTRREIQSCLKRIATIIRAKRSKQNAEDQIASVRDLLNRCSDFDWTSTSDASELMMLLCDVFALPDDASRHVSVFGTNDIVSTHPIRTVLTSNREEKCGIVLHVSDGKICLDSTQDSGPLDAPYEFDTPSGKQTFMRSITMTKYQFHHFLVVYIPRENSTQRNQVDIPSRFDTKPFAWSVSHHGGHWTSIVRIDEETFMFYDDLKSRSGMIRGTFEHICNIQSLATNAVLVCYTDV